MSCCTPRSSEQQFVPAGKLELSLEEGSPALRSAGPPEGAKLLTWVGSGKSLGGSAPGRFAVLVSHFVLAEGCGAAAFTAGS